MTAQHVLYKDNYKRPLGSRPCRSSLFLLSSRYLKIICILGYFANVFSAWLSFLLSSATERLPCSDHSSTGMCTQTILCLCHLENKAPGKQTYVSCTANPRSLTHADGRLSKLLNIRVTDSGLPDGLFKSRRPLPGPP